jgi:hypothetical protein
LLDGISVHMNTNRDVDHFKGDPRFAGRTRSVKAKPVAALERTATTPLGSFRGWKRHDSDTDPEGFRKQEQAIDETGRALRTDAFGCVRLKNLLV